MAKHKKKLRILPSFVVIVFCLALAYGAFALSRPLPAVAATVENISHPTSKSKANLPWPNASQSAIGAVGYGILATHGQQKPLATASTAKIMTALAVLHKHPLKLGEQGPKLTITPQDQAIYDYYYERDGSLAAQKVGEKITEYQALQAMLLPSGNNFADILANWAYGSLEKYSDYANQYAKTIGMTNSHFVDGSGFSSESTSTASDLTHLAIVAIQNPVIAQIVGQKTAKIPVAGTIYNVNWLLGQRGIIGMKTGNNNQDHGAYIAATKFSVKGKPITMITVVMGASRLDKALLDSIPLIDAAKQNFHNEADFLPRHTVVGHYTTPWGSSAEAVTVKSLESVVIWGNSEPSYKTVLGPLEVPTGSGSIVGHVEFDNGTRPIPVKLTSDLSAAPLKWRLTHF